MTTHSEKPNRSNEVLGIILVVVGGLFLLSQLFGFNVWRVAWPFFVLIPGVLLVIFGLAVGQAGLPFSIIGMVVTIVGVILGYQALTSQWASWSYLWALVAPTGVGLGMLLHGYWTHQQKLLDSGRRVTFIGLIIAVAGWAFFEIVLGLNGFIDPAVGRIVGPLVLIVLGSYLLWQRYKAPTQ
jgi:hypothetical protein